MLAQYGWIAAAIGANIVINLIEYLNRTQGWASPWQALKVTAPLILLAQIGLFYTWRYAPTMMVGWAVFTAGNAVIRLVSNHYFVGEPLSYTASLGVAVMFAGMMIVKGGS